MTAAHPLRTPAAAVGGFPATVVLVVEDNPADAHLVEEALESADPAEHFEAVTVGTLAEAVTVVRDAPPDVILLDLGLPDSRGLTGVEALQGLAPDIPLIVLTGQDDAELGRRALHKGAQDYLLKGEASPSQLQRAVRYAISRQAMTAALRDSQARFHNLFSEAPVGLRCLALDGTIIEVNRALVALSGYPAARLLGMHASALAHPADRTRESAILGRLAAGEDAYQTYEMRMRRADGGVRHVQVSATLVRDAAGAPAYTSAVVTDATERIEARAEVEASGERLRALVQGVSDVITVHDDDGDLVYISPSGARLFGDTDTATVAHSLWPMIHPDDVARVRQTFAVWKAGGTSFARYRIQHCDGNWIHCESIGVNLLSNPAVAGVVVTTRDVTERKKAMEELAYQAMHDGLTGLPNRTLFLDRLTQALGRRRRTGSALAVLFLDLDNFKFINDSYGHQSGDEVLKAVAELLEMAIRPGDTISRLGGDEFAVVCEDVPDVATAQAVADRLAAAVRTGFGVRDHVLHVSTSIGIAFTGPDDPNVTAHDLLHDADVALYAAKDRGRARTEVFDDDLRHRAVRRVELEEALRNALANDELDLHYQPQVDIEHGEVIGFEALLRWHHPVLGRVGPDEFVPLAESTGLIGAIGRWVLDKACRQMAAWGGGGVENGFTMAVNLSAVQLADPGLVETVRDTLARHGVDPASLCLEITETVVMEDASLSADSLMRLKALGVRLAIDDFGTGYSSLAYLKRFAVDELKVDRAFVHGLGRDPEDTVIVASVIGLASSLGLAVVAEGVETEDQLHELRALGCARAQGYLWSGAEPPERAHPWLGRPVAMPERGTGELPVERRVGPAGRVPGVDDIVSTLADELRTPITVIRGFAETLGELMVEGRTDALDHALAAITRQTEGMEALLGCLGDMRALESGTLVLRRERLSLADAVRRVAADWTPGPDGRRVDVVVEADAVVSADRDRLAQILGNLVRNALRHAPPGSVVKVVTGAVGDRATMRVVDEGPGVPVHRVGDLFGRFSRVELGRGGVGLGLYLARALARAHGGDVAYRGAETGGGEFIVSLPMAIAGGR